MLYLIKFDDCLRLTNFIIAVLSLWWENYEFILLLLLLPIDPKR